MLGVIFRLFKLAWYLVWLPVHIVMVFVTAALSCMLLVLDVVIWVGLGEHVILSNVAVKWFYFHLDKILGD